MSMPPLAWDDALGVGAATYAQQMAFTGTFQNIRTARRGEASARTLRSGTHGAFSIEAMVGGWAAEKRYFLPGIFRTTAPAIGRCQPATPR